MNVEEEIKKLNLPIGLYEFCIDELEMELNSLNNPDMYILTLTSDGESIKDYILEYHHDSDGNLIWSSINRYGYVSYNIDYDGETYNVILVNNSN